MSNKTMVCDWVSKVNLDPTDLNESYGCPWPQMLQLPQMLVSFSTFAPTAQHLDDMTTASDQLENVNLASVSLTLPERTKDMPYKFQVSLEWFWYDLWGQPTVDQLINNYIAETWPASSHKPTALITLGALTCHAFHVGQLLDTFFL